jgi:hypothetical protein
MSIPAAATAKLAILKDREHEAQSMVTATMRRIAELSHALATSPEDAAGSMEHEIARLRGKLGEYQTQHQSRAGVNARVREWLAKLGPGVELTMAKHSRAKLNIGETETQALARLRAEIAKLQAERRRVQSAAPTIPEMKAAASEHVAWLAKRGTPRMTAEHGRFDLAWSADTFGNPKPDAGAVLAWLDPAALTKRLHEQIDALPKALRMTAKAKAEKLDQIAGTLLTLEREEEAFIDALESDGHTISRRSDASPAGILGVFVAKKATVAA